MKRPEQGLADARVMPHHSPQSPCSLALGLLPVWTGDRVAIARQELFARGPGP